MGLYIHLNSKLWENKDIYYPPPQLRGEVLLLVLDEFKKCLKSEIGFEQGEVSLWRTDIMEELGGERVDGEAEEKFKSEPGLILLLKGFINVKEKIPVRVVVSNDRDFRVVFGDLYLEVEPESQYEDIVELLHSFNEEEFKSFLGKITETLSEFNKNSVRRIAVGNYEIKNIIDYAYISQFPVNKDITEMYYLYKPSGVNVEPVRNIIDMAAETVLNNKDFEDEVPPVIQSSKSAFTEKNAVVKFLSEIDRVKEIVNNVSNDYLRIDTTHSLVIQFPRSRDEREEFYMTIRDMIITPLFSVFPPKNMILENYLEKIDEQSHRF
jgi:hypothetical protein